jgi:hypothetical protein
MGSLQNYERDDPNFIDDLLASQKAVWIAAQLLVDCGETIMMRPLSIRPDIKDMSKYADQGDIFILREGGWRAVEVKHRTLEFTGKDDYPFPTVIVNNRHIWDRADPKPFAHIIFNKDLSVLCLVMSETSDQWKLVEKMDYAKNRMRTFYVCPKELCGFAVTGRVPCH